MRKIFVGARVSIDGVIQAPDAPTDAPTKGFAFCGWMMPYRCREGGEELDSVFEEKFDLQDLRESDRAHHQGSPDGEKEQSQAVGELTRRGPVGGGI